MLLLDGLADDTVAALLGLDRFEDLPGRSESTLIASPLSGAPIKGCWALKEFPLSVSLASDVVRDLTQHIWHGKANRLSRDDPCHGRSSIRWKSHRGSRALNRRSANRITTIL